METDEPLAPIYNWNPETGPNFSVSPQDKLNLLGPLHTSDSFDPEIIQPRSLVQLLIKKFILDPTEGRQILKDYGLWDVLKEVLWQPITIRLARLDPNVFLEYIMVDSETGATITQQPFQKAWQHSISNHKYTLIGAFRGSGKSINVAGRAVWELGSNHNLRVKIVGSNDTKSQEILGLIGELIKTSPRVHEVFPDLEIDSARGDTKSAFFIKRTIPMRDPSVQGSGVLSAGAGGRADLLICDDVVDENNSVVNAATRDVVTNAVRKVWFSLVSATGRVVWICTPYHIADASMTFKNDASGLWNVLWNPAISYQEVFDPDTGKPIMEVARDSIGDPILDPITLEPKLKIKKIKVVLWPEKWPEDKLAERLQALQQTAFESQYMLNPISDGDRTFPDKNLEASFDLSLAFIGEGIPAHWPTFGGVDLASALGKKNAWTVIWTLARNPETGKIHLKEMWRDRVGFTDTVEQIVIQAKKHNWCYGYVENNGYQQAVIDAIERSEDNSLPIEGFNTNAYGKINQEIGLPGLSVAFGKGHFAIPAARLPLLPEEGSDLAIFMNELQTHPVGEFSDTIMAFWFAWRAALAGTGNFVKSYLESLLII